MSPDRSDVVRAGRPLRIAHFTLGRCSPDSANGIDRSVYHLARVQALRGHRSAVFSLTDKPPIPIPGSEVFTIPPVRPPIPLPTERLRDLLGHRAVWNVPRRLVEAVLAWAPDVLHLHFVHIPQNVFLARRLSPRVPYCVTIHGALSADAQRRSRWLKRTFRALFERDYLERAAFLHVISEHDVDGLKRYGIANRTVMAPNGIDIEPPASRGGDALRLLDPRLTGRHVFLFIGRLDPQQKGLDLLVRAFAASRPEGWALVLVGPDWRNGRQQLERLVESLRLGDHVVMPGPAFGARRADLLRAADVFVHPSRWEAGVPFSVLEAAAQGCACLITPMADAGHVLGRSGGAVSVDPSAEAIAEGLRLVSGSSAEERTLMGARAREAVASAFNWERTVDILTDAYRTFAMTRGE